MTDGSRGSHSERRLWEWIAGERKRRGISQSELARNLGICREALRETEEGRNGSEASTLLDALRRFDALGAIAEIDGMDWSGAVLSLSGREAESYDAIAEARGVTRGQVVRELAEEGLLARGPLQ